MTAAKRGGKRIGYIRVSSLDQSTERQLDGLDLDKRFTDKASGKDAKRPNSRMLLNTSAKATCSSSTRWTGWPGILTTCARSSWV